MGTKTSTVENLVFVLVALLSFFDLLVLYVAVACYHATTKGFVELNWISVNDPSAGSPTETLLRLLLPLSDKV